MTERFPIECFVIERFVIEQSRTVQLEIKTANASDIL